MYYLASDRSVQQSVGDAREALINAAVDMLTSFGSTLVSSQRVGQLPCPRNLRLIPLYVLALSKYVSYFECSGVQFLNKLASSCSETFF